MTEFHPFAELRGDVLHLQISGADAVRSFEVRCVVDLTDFGEVVGVEILDLVRQLGGGEMDPPRHKGAISWSYDDEIDALYVHVAEGRGQVQRSLMATAHVDPSGRVVAVAVPVPETV